MPSLDERLALIGDALERGAQRSAQRRRRRKRTARLAVIAAIAVVAAVGSALAASSLLGGPAPADVQTAIDQFYPADPGNSMAPAPGGATAVASFGDDVLYRLPARDGVSVCLGVVLAHPSNGKPIPGEGCMAMVGGPDEWLPMVSGLGSGDGRLLIFGKVSAATGDTFWIEPAEQSPQQIPLGKDGFFLIERTISAQATSTDTDALDAESTRFILRDATGALLQQRVSRGMAVGTPISP